MTARIINWNNFVLAEIPLTATRDRIYGRAVVQKTGETPAYRVGDDMYYFDRPITVFQGGCFILNIFAAVQDRNKKRRLVTAFRKKHERTHQ